MKTIIENTLKKVIEEDSKKSTTFYRTPLLGYAEAEDSLFHQLTTAGVPNHLLPTDLLPGARTVAAFFLPFTGELVKRNRQDHYVARSWAQAYIDTNWLINRCCQEIAAALDRYGVKTAWQRPTHNFDLEKLRARWSHKHVAYICGLGNFGLHHMLITPSGCAGRFGSLVIDYTLPPTPRKEIEPCLFFREGKCQQCVKNCPSGALTPEGLDDRKCYDYLLEVDSFYSDLGVCDVCGKCATCGPCAVIG
ncbi:MAG TPA: epoxyqueuosine reductase [Clostridia bacterium]|nr:epoxyqueuosine reductase [Clostridia bacterium]